MKPQSMPMQASRLGERKPIGLALQGGGSWGAYTWGVLDALLSSADLAIAQLSGTSAGAINAAIVASAVAKGSPEQAREALASFWRCIAEPAAAGLIRAALGPLGRHWRDALADWMLNGAAFNMPVASALGLNPLRDAVAEHVDIAAIRSDSAPALFVTVTNVRTGLPRVISNRELSLDALLASACLPTLFPTVELDGEHYWDGGYAGNPTVWPMIRSGLADDLILVQLVPERIEEVPLDTPSIRRRVAEIVFNASLASEMRAIVAMRQLAAPPGATDTRVAGIRLHRIGPPRAHLYDEGNGADRAPEWLHRLRDEGAGAAERFMAAYGTDLGVRETLDVGRAFFESHASRTQPLHGGADPAPATLEGIAPRRDPNRTSGLSEVGSETQISKR